MVTSNIREKNKALVYGEHSFYQVSESISEYARSAENTFAVGITYEGHDHFSHTMRAIDHVFSHNDNLEYVMTEINNNIALKRWAAAVICMMIYGSYQGYRLAVKSYTVENHPFLKVWKSKFLHNNNDDNCPTNAQDTNNMYVYEFVLNEIGSAIGCYSKRYCIIPAKNVERNNNSWTELFYSLLNCSDLKHFIGRELPAEYMIKLKFSAEGIANDSPLNMIKALILDALQLNIEYRDDVPHISFGNLRIYDIEDTKLSKYVLCNDIYVTKKDNSYISLYPFRKTFAENLENKIASVEEMTMTCKKEDEKLKEVTVAGKFCHRIHFLDNSDDNNRDCTIPFYFEEKKIYSGSSIKSADTVGTFCAYPDIPVEYEDRCRSYHYLYDLSVNVSGNGRACDLELSGVQSKKAYNGDDIYIYSSESPIHLFNVSLHKTNYSSENRHAGCIINVRMLDHECTPAMLEENSSVQINLNTNIIQPNRTMYIYMDYGSSSSSVGYKLENGTMPLNDITGSTSIVRELVGKFNKEKYSLFLNMPSCYTKRLTIPSVVIEHCESAFCDECFDNVLVPFHRSFSEYEKAYMKICDVDKSLMARREGNIDINLKAYIYNLCYTALCHVINLNCGRAVFIQSFPNRSYQTIYDTIMRSICEYFGNTVFPGLPIDYLINCNNNYLLYESLALTNIIPPNQMADNNLIIGIDIGDSTTDMAAVYCNNGNRTFCGYSSINYAGKHLLKGALFDIMYRLGKSDRDSYKQKLKIFLIGENNNGGVFRPKDGITSDTLQALAELLSDRFVCDLNDDGSMKNQAWENILLEILDWSDININGFDSALKSDLVYRYALLIPVIADFIDTSLNSCGHRDASVSLNFYGGGSKGILLVDDITHVFKQKLREYLEKRLDKCNLRVDVPQTDSKKMLLRGLESLMVMHDNDDNYNVVLNGNGAVVCDWNYIAPREINRIRSELRRSRCAQYNIRPLNRDDDTNRNKNERYKMSNFINVPSRELLYFVSEIANDLIPNELRIDRLNIANKHAIAEKINHSFEKAADAEIYPEMMRTTTFLFELSRLISESIKNMPN